MMGLIGQLLDSMVRGRELPLPKKEEPMLMIGSITVDQIFAAPDATQVKNLVQLMAAHLQRQPFVIMHHRCRTMDEWMGKHANER